MSTEELYMRALNYLMSSLLVLRVFITQTLTQINLRVLVSAGVISLTFVS